ncbi:MAG: Crp/Fnr family transcriptional regulator [Bacteroidota bacterium]
MSANNNKSSIRQIDTSIFREELEKRIQIPEGAFEQLLELWEYRTFKKNEIIMHADEVPKWSLFVLKGCLRQFLVSDKGDERVVYFAEERHFIGDLAALRNRQPSVFTFQAIEACELLTINAENWIEAQKRFTWWTEAYINGYQRWTMLMQQQLADSASLTTEEQYVRLLETKPKLLLRVPQHYIASYLGVSPETLSRVRKKMMNL